MTHDEMIDEAVRRAPEWAHQHLLNALLDPCGGPCEHCEAAAKAIRAKYLELFEALSKPVLALRR